MGLLDSIAGQVTGAITGNPGGTEAKLLEAVSTLISKSGGLQGLLAMFQQKGLGDIAASWVGTGQNSPISGDQLQSVLGSGSIRDIAAALGLSPGDASNSLARLLPQVIDKLTPNGQVAEGGNLAEQGMAMLKNLKF
ncbi:MAG: DUF937 domain-containing protein [Burkholderiales bacterium]|nr:DUF937 domain-containing protein [Burkholderiales bacterium]